MRLETHVESDRVFVRLPLIAYSILYFLLLRILYV
jgi:hypothetical protein